MKDNSIGNYIVERQLGAGASAFVYQGFKKNDPSYKVAIKQFKQIKTSEETPNNPIVQQFLKEGQFLEYLNQIRATGKFPSDLQYLNQLIERLKLSNQESCFYFLVLEFAKNGDLCDFLCNNPWLPEAIAACYNEQAARAVKFMHDLNVAHMDIKPENMLLDENFILKLADFGNLMFNNAQSNENCGTKGYKAPEIHRGELYQSKPADIFSLGVTFVAIRSGVHPFRDTQPDINQEIYKNLISRPEKFWEQVVEFSEQENKIKIIFEEDFKDLIERMLYVVPSKRPTIDQVLAHPYFTRNQKIKQQDLIQFMINQYLQKTEFNPAILLNYFERGMKKINKPQLRLIVEQISLNTFAFYNIDKLEKERIKQKIDTFIDKHLLQQNLKLPKMPEEVKELNLHKLIAYEQLQVGTILEEHEDLFYWSLIDIKGDKMQLAKLKKRIREILKDKIDENKY